MSALLLALLSAVSAGAAQPLTSRERGAIRACLAGLYATEGLEAQAEAEYKEGIAADPELGLTRNLLANLYARQRRWPEAVALLEENARRDAKDVESRFDLARFLLLSGRPVEALPWIDSVLGLSPASAPAYNVRGNIFAAMGRHDQAEQAYAKSLSLSPSASAHSDMGALLLRQGREAQARREFNKALELEPGQASARSALSELERKGSKR